MSRRYVIIGLQTKGKEAYIRNNNIFETKEDAKLHFPVLLGNCFIATINIPAKVMNFVTK